MAFRIAAQADPKAQLVYNDYGLEYDTPENEAKRNAVLKLLEHLKSREVPIHAFGIQSHLLAHETRFNPQKLQKFLKEVADLGLKIMVTEPGCHRPRITCGCGCSRSHSCCSL